MFVDMPEGPARFVHGRLRYEVPPEIGTVVGPNAIGEHMVVVGRDGEWTLLAYATVPDLTAARDRALAGDFRSITEMRIQPGALPGSRS